MLIKPNFTHWIFKCCCFLFEALPGGCTSFVCSCCVSVLVFFPHYLTRYFYEFLFSLVMHFFLKAFMHWYFLPCQVRVPRVVGRKGR